MAELLEHHRDISGNRARADGLRSMRARIGAHAGQVSRWGLLLTALALVIALLGTELSSYLAVESSTVPLVRPDCLGHRCRVDVATMRRYCSHVNVGVRSLKEHLSEYLERAARGETIVVTDRGEPKAMLGPVPGRLDLERGIAEKWIRAGSGEPPRPVRRFKPRIPAADVLREDRGE